MICYNTKELLAEIKKYMDINSQSVSQYFKNGNPNCNTLFKICDALNIQLDIRLINKSDTSQ